MRVIAGPGGAEAGLPRKATAGRLRAVSVLARLGRLSGLALTSSNSFRRLHYEDGGRRRLVSDSSLRGVSLTGGPSGTEGDGTAAALRPAGRPSPLGASRGPVLVFASGNSDGTKGLCRSTEKSSGSLTRRRVKAGRAGSGPGPEGRSRVLGRETAYSFS